MENRKKELRIVTVRREKAVAIKGVDTRKFCSLLKLKEDSLLIEKRLRDEWG